jgi:hypothetical protein
MAKGGGCCWLPPAELSWVSLRHVQGRSEADLIAWFNLPTFIAFKLNICLDITLPSRTHWRRMEHYDPQGTDGKARALKENVKSE